MISPDRQLYDLFPQKFRDVYTSVISPALSANDSASALGVLAEIAQTHPNIDLLTHLLLERMRAVLLLRNAPHLEKVLSERFGEDEMTFLQELAKSSSRGINSNTLHQVLSAVVEMPHSPIPQLPLELALARMAEERSV